MGGRGSRQCRKRDGDSCRVVRPCMRSNQLAVNVKTPVVVQPSYEQRVQLSLEKRRGDGDCSVEPVALILSCANAGGGKIGPKVHALSREPQQVRPFHRGQQIPWHLNVIELTEGGTRDRVEWQGKHFQTLQSCKRARSSEYAHERGRRGGGGERERERDHISDYILYIIHRSLGQRNTPWLQTLCLVDLPHSRLRFRWTGFGDA